MKILFLMILLTLALSACGVTLKELSNEYPNYTVIGKEVKKQTKKVPRYVMYCVKPNGDIRCKREYGSGALSSCAFNCRTDRKKYSNPDKWVKRQEGTKDSVSSIYLLKLQSPSGDEIVYKSNYTLFKKIRKGQVLTPECNLSTSNNKKKGADSL